MNPPSGKSLEWIALIGLLVAAPAVRAAGAEKKLTVHQVIDLLPEYAAVEHFDSALEALDVIRSVEGLTRQRQFDLAFGLVQLESAMLRAGQVDKALLAARKARALFPREARTGLDLGGMLITNGLYKEAVPVLQEALAQGADLYPIENVDKVAAYTNLGKAYLLSDSPQEALAPLFKAVALGPSHAAALYLLGEAYIQIGQQDQNALRNLERAYDLDPQEAGENDLVNLIDLLYEAGRYDKVVQVASYGTQRFPVARGLRMYWGMCLEKAGQSAEAYYKYQHERLLGGAKSKYAILTGRRLFELSQQARSTPKDPQHRHIVICVLGLVNSEPGKYDQAVRFFEMAIKEWRRPNAVLELFLAEAHASLKAYPAAIEHFRRSIEIDPYLSPAYVEHGDVLRKDGQPREAILEYRKAILLDPENWKVKRLLEEADRQTDRNQDNKGTN